MEVHVHVLSYWSFETTFPSWQTITILFNFFFLSNYRHEKDKHPNLDLASTEVTVDRENKESDEKEDHILNYHKAKLAYGLLLFDFGDAIREGDGGRLLNLYKLALLIYSSHGHNKYAYVTLLFLVRIYAILDESEATSLICNRFCNTVGKMGHNIPLDLRLEHSNNLLKACLKALGANVNENSAQRVAAALNGIEMVLDSIDKDCQFSSLSNVRGGKDPKESVMQIVTDLISGDVFSKHNQRDGYTGFSEFNANIIAKLNYAEFYHWIRNKLKEWKRIYSRGQ